MARTSTDMIKRVMWPLAPVPGESLMGFVARVAAHNVIDDTLSITAQAGQAFGHRASLVYSADADLGTLALALRVEEAELRARAHPPADDRALFFGLRIPRSHLESKRRRFSPASLAVGAYHRAVWQYRPVPFCAESWEYLTDRCSLCGTVQRFYHARGVDRCDACGDSLTDAVANTVPEASRDILSFAVGMVDPLEERRIASMRRLPPPLAGLGPEHLLELMWHLRYLTAPTGLKVRRDTAWRDDPQGHTERMRVAAELVLGWPDKPLELVGRRLAARHGSGNDATLRATSAFFRTEQLRLLSAPVRSVVRSLYDAMDPTAPSQSMTTRPITLHASKAICGLSNDELAEHRRCGRLRSVPFVGSFGKLIAGFDESEIRWLGDAMRSRKSASAVAADLGISLHGVEQLVCLRLLNGIDHPVFAARYDRLQFEEEAVDKFLEHVRSAATAPLAGIPLRQAVRIIPGAKPWGPIVAAMLDGRLPFGPAPDNRLVCSAVISPKSLPFVQGLRFDKVNYPAFDFDRVMSKKDALDSLNLNASDGRFLQPGMTARATPTDYRVVRVDFVEQMSRDHVSLSELLARSGRRPAEIRRALTKGRVGTPTAFGWPRATAEAVLFGSG